MFTQTPNFSNLLSWYYGEFTTVGFWAKTLSIMIGLSVITLAHSEAIAKKKQNKTAVTQAKSKKARIPKYKQKIVNQVAVSPPSIYGAENLAAIINNAIYNVDPNLNIGVAIKSMQHGDVLYTKNQYRTFVPASILKIVTAETALLYLGSDYKFQTNLYTDAKTISNGVLYGNLYLVHSGDPTLTYKDLIALIDTLRSRQIKQVAGNVFIDTTAYDDVNYGPGWLWDDTRYCYAAPISASIINHNCLSFQVAPGKAEGKPATIIQSPNHFFSSIQNAVVTKSPYARSCYIRLGNNSDSSISITGCMPKGRYAQGVSTVITDILEYNKSMVRFLFNRSGITISGAVGNGKKPANLPVLAVHESKPLHNMVSDMLKKSDNIIAGSLFKKIGAAYSKEPGSWTNGSSAVAEILSKKAGVDTSNMNALDGSGLSRYNLVTPKQMLQLLDFAYHHNGTNYNFIYGLPVAGIDGTLKHRLSNIAWKVRAKTGTMKGVRSLAGYAITKDKEPIAFVIIVNGKHQAGWQYKELEDRIVTAITKYSR